jgi:hypothetical protein
MSTVFLTLAKCCVGWGLLFERAAHWFIARAYEGLGG